MTGLWHRMTLVLVLLCVCLWGTTDGGVAVESVRPKRKPKKPAPTPIAIELNPDVPPVDMTKMWGQWYLLNMASTCPHQLKQRATSEATVMHLTPPEQAQSPVSVSTKTRFNHACWEILQQYYPTQTNGHYLLKAKMDSEPDTDVIIMEVDDAYAFILYHKKGKVTVKLYGRATVILSEPMLTKFEKLSEKKGMSLAYLFPFPTFGHCESVTKDHIIDCVPTC